MHKYVAIDKFTVTYKYKYTNTHLLTHTKTQAHKKECSDLDVTLELVFVEVDYKILQ